jgi:hypothetical protein
MGSPSLVRRWIRDAGWREGGMRVVRGERQSARLFLSLVSVFSFVAGVRGQNGAFSFFALAEGRY